MSEIPFIDLLIVDHPSPDIPRVVETLQAAGYSVQELRSDQDAEISDFIHYKPIDLIMVRLAEDLPKIPDIRAHVTAADQDIPILAMLEDTAQQQQVEALRAGADNCFFLSDPEHLVMTVRKEIHHLRIRQESRSREIKLKESEERCRALLESSLDAIAYIHEGAHIYANPAYRRLFGSPSSEELAGVTLMSLVIPDDRDRLKAFLRETTKSGRSLEPIALTGMDVNGGQFPMHMECVLTRMNEEPCLQIRIENPGPAQGGTLEADGVGGRDELTGFYNRKYFTEYLNQICAEPGETRGAVIYILLTDYRTLSEHLGLEAVDQLVIDLAKLLQSRVPGNELIAHFSDAVFTIYTPDSSNTSVLALGERLCEAVKAHVTNAARKLISTTSSIGICMIQKTHDNAMQILAQVDRVCEIARQMGGNQVQIFPPLVSKPAEPQQEERISVLIRDAMQGERISLLYQPIAAFQGKIAERYKAFLRVLGEDKKPLPMSTFGSVAESRGLMGPLDRWVISHGLKNVSKRYRATGKQTTLFVRISQNSIIDEEFSQWLGAYLKDVGLDGNSLVIEVAEQGAEKCLMETKTLRDRLNELGCGFALSHCSGRANSERMLNYLTPDFIKLDGKLIEKLIRDKEQESLNLVARLTQQAQAKKTMVVAADVSTAPQMASIWQFGVTLVQGDMVQEVGKTMDFDFQQFAV